MPPNACARSCVYLCLAAFQVILLYSILVVRPPSMMKTSEDMDANNHWTNISSEFGRFSEFSVSKTNHMGLQQRACRPVKKFGFLKTHKCGSTTIQNMLLRYVVKHDLNLVVPVDGEGNYIS